MKLGDYKNPDLIFKLDEGFLTSSNYLFDSADYKDCNSAFVAII